MRELIRPALFWVVRLGLFFAVVAWIAGQWWQGFGMASSAIGFIDQTGVAIQYFEPI